MTRCFRVVDLRVSIFILLLAIPKLCLQPNLLQRARRLETSCVNPFFNCRATSVSLDAFRIRLSLFSIWAVNSALMRD